MTSLAISRCKNSSHVILRFEENRYNAGGRLEFLTSIYRENLRKKHKKTPYQKITKLNLPANIEIHVKINGPT